MRPDELPDDPVLDRLLERLDHPVPPVSLDAVRRRARRRRLHSLARAAAVVLGLAAAGSAAHALPGSPLRGWLDVAGRRSGAIGTESAAGPVDVGLAPPDSAGIDLPPDRDLSITFLEEALTGTLVVSLTEEGEVRVRTSSAATVFTSEPSRLLVRHASADTVRIALPRSRSRVEILVGGRRVLLWDGARLTTEPDAVRREADRYVVDLTDAPGG